MKSKYLLLFVFICGLIVMNSCNSGSKKENAKADDTINNREVKTGSLEMSINPFQYDSVPEKVMLTIVNNTADTLQFGADYEIESLVNNNWQSVPLSGEIAFISIMYGLVPGESQEYEIYLYPEMTEYSPGSYRIRKTFLKGESNEVNYAEFEIK